jgi:hypothetical protein
LELYVAQSRFSRGEAQRVQTRIPVTNHQWNTQ